VKRLHINPEEIAMTPNTALSAPMGYLSRAEAWLDARGRGAWIAAMVAGFILFWPVGLALVLYMSMAGKWSLRRDRRPGRGVRMHAPTSGNGAFDAYRDATLRRLEEEQQAFEEFLQRLRDAKDKAEFDQFMEERSTRDAADAGDAADSARR
jgi:hypothetical protein